MLEILNQFHDAKLGKQLVTKVHDIADAFHDKFGRRPAYMEVCGSHTMAFARTGVKKIMQGKVDLISGPGCPVCVTDQKSIDAMLELANTDNRILCTFGDMIRVPGSNGTLLQARTEGKDIRIVYSPTDAVKIAEENPTKEVIFLGIGFETTIPILAVALQEAHNRQLKNFSMWVTTKLVEPILRYLLDSGEARVDGFILPGHVSIVLGEEGYRYLTEEYHVPGVISGFEPIELLSGIYKLTELALNDEAGIINNYKRVVTPTGNKHTQAIIEEFFEPSDEAWRGIGLINNSGMDIREKYAHLNAKNRFSIEVAEPRKTKCRCGEIIRGLVGPEDCPLFGKACTPANPIGPCMVSSEGSCSAHYHYMREA
ncbi:hydrogenase formation protein HypD [Bacillus sp. HMF5848]|uniref:hydrogenase formation protein HypD n=1 Tax=Bacillus sp. HMF5848 TaxID=2495421 RepID=UPI000F78DB58|nr:hydrogenase formation protein HypD [Bacillus sp. HMF5848]RSK27289.1 hydrogenase formation protein HypD [Bacillus sp. HMF5848]